jgi:hypothetical protein
MVEKLNYFKVENGKKFRFIPRPTGSIETIKVLYKNLGKGKPKEGVNGDPPNPKDRMKARTGCELFLPRLEQMYSYRLPGDGAEIKSEITYTEALQKHRLIYSTVCGDSENETYSPNECVWCKLYDEGVRTLQRYKSIIGFIVSEDNEVMILKRNSGTFAESVQKALFKKDSQKYWIEISVKKNKNGMNEWSVKTSKEPIKDYDKLNEELESKYDIDKYDLDNPDFSRLTAYYVPEEKTEDE